MIAAATVISTRLLEVLAVATCFAGLGGQAVSMSKMHMNCSPSRATDGQDGRDQDAKKPLHASATG